MRFGRKTVSCLLLLLATLIASSGSEPPDENESRADMMTRYRLPNNTIPQFYNINIEPNMDGAALTWTGKISIDIEVVDPTATVTLHAHKNLVIDENFTKLVDATGTKLSPVEHSRDVEVEFLKLKFDREIPAGNYSLRLKFEGAIDNAAKIGFYKASRGRKNTTSVAATHFEPTSARRAFPCWDEPDFKARFRVSVKHFSNYTAVSNMPEIERVETPDGKILTTFDTTPIMSTYLLTYVISDYESVFNEHRNVSLHTSARDLEYARHILDFSPKVVRVMESYTGLPFGMSRIGSVLVPTYSSAATEHWGMVSYFADAVVIEKWQDISNVDRVQMLIAHELSHAWFGNRVSPLWWDDLWLNEAFAAYFQYYIMDEIYENWGGVDLFVVRNNQELAFNYADDGYDRPVKWTPVTTKEARQLFAQTTYRKGSAIVHMFRNVIGDSAFRAGIQKFLARHSFKSAQAEDLMNAFQEAYNEGPNTERPLNVEKTMMSWLTQQGYPMVNVSRNYTTGDTRFSQKGTGIDSPLKLWIPLTYATKSRPNFTSTLPTRWISDKEDHVEIDDIDKDDWIIVNIRASGFYRVNYDDENWNRLAEYLTNDDYRKIHVLNRAQLIDDVVYLAMREPRRYLRIFYKITKYLSREVEYLPWRITHHAIRNMKWQLRNTKVQDAFQRHFVEMTDKLIEKVGFEERDTDDHFTKLSRAQIVDWACSSGHPRCSEYAAPKLMEMMENPVKAKSYPYTISWIFCSGLRILNETAEKQFADWAFEHEKMQLIFNFGCTKNREVHKTVLTKCLTKNVTGEYGMYTVYNNLLTSSKENFDSAVDFVLENHQAIISSDSQLTASEFVHAISNAVTNAAQLEKLKAVLRLDAVVNDPNISTTDELDRAEQSAARENATSVLTQEMSDLLFSGDNSISGSRTETH